MRNIKKLRVASFSAYTTGSPSSIQPGQCCPVGGRNADKALRTANNPAARAAGEGVGGGVNPSPGWLFGDWSWFGGVGGSRTVSTAVGPRPRRIIFSDFVYMFFVSSGVMFFSI